MSDKWQYRKPGIGAYRKPGIGLAILWLTGTMAFGQTYRESMNLMPAGNPSPPPAKKKIPDYPPPAQPMKTEDLRLVDGKIYHPQFSPIWQRHVGYLYDNNTNGPVKIMDVSPAQGSQVWLIAVKNLDPAKVVHGKNFSFQAMKTGVYEWIGGPVELWDCGTIPVVQQQKTNAPTSTNAVVKTNPPVSKSVK